MEIFRREGSGLLDHIEGNFLMYDFILSKLNSETEKKFLLTFSFKVKTPKWITVNGKSKSQGFTLLENTSNAMKSSASA